MGIATRVYDRLDLSISRRHLGIGEVIIGVLTVAAMVSDLRNTVNAGGMAEELRTGIRIRWLVADTNLAMVTNVSDVWSFAPALLRRAMPPIRNGRRGRAPSPGLVRRPPPRILANARWLP